MTQEKPNNLDSIITIYDIIEGRFKMQHELIGSLDTKLALVITFSGVIIAIIFQVNPTNKGTFFFMAVGFLIVAISLSFIGYKTKKYREDPDPRMLKKKYLDKNKQQILKQVIINLTSAYNENRKKLKNKAELFTLSLISLGIGLICLILQLIF